MKIIIDDEIPYIKGVLEPYADVAYMKGDAISADSVKDADALMVRTWTVCDEKLLAHSSVRFVATATAGMNHIDTGWCGRNGIIAANAPGCNSMGVVQYLFTSYATLRGPPPKAGPVSMICANCWKCRT